MAIERDDKLLNGAGLEKYTELLKLHLDGVTTTIAGDITTAVTTAVNAATTALIGDATSDGDTLGKLEDRIDSIEEDALPLLSTVITEVYGNTAGTDPSRIDNLEDAVNGITTTAIPGIQDQITALTTSLTTTYKTLQEVKENTAPTGTYFIGIGQNTQGVITAITATFPTAATTTQGMVTMDSGATTSVVYDKEQVDSIISGIEGTIDGITTTISGISTTVDGLTTIIGDITTPLDETFKALQSATALTAPTGEYISGITQDAQGVVGITTLALPTVPTASSTTPGLVTVVGVTNPTGTAYEVYSKEKLDELLDDVIGGDLSGIDGRLSDLEGSTTGVGAKRLQAAVSSPTAGSSPVIEFIDTISQNANGDITATKQAVRTAAANVSGIVSLATGATTAVVYDANQVDAKIAEAEAAAFVAEITDTLPASGDVNTIYFVSNGTGTTPNYYTEYMYVNNGWEVVGNTELAIETLNNTEIENIFNGAFNS